MPELETDSAALQEVRGSSSGRVLIEACSSAGRCVGVEVRVRLDTVEVACNGALCGVFDRDELRGWLAEPGPVIEVDDVAFGTDYLIDSAGRVTISVRRVGVQGWALSPSDHAALSARV